MMQPQAKLKVVGFDPSLNNWGIAAGLLTLDTLSLKIGTVDVVQPVLPTGKQVRQNSIDLESAYQLCTKALLFAREADVIFVEVPVGSQSARAMASYGICVGILGALRAVGTPFFEVTPTEVKLASVGNKTATKKEMIAWATSKHPEANWPYYKRNGKDLISEGNAEHMADATAAIYAGLACHSFKQMLSLLQLKVAA